MSYAYFTGRGKRGRDLDRQQVRKLVAEKQNVIVSEYDQDWWTHEAMKRLGGSFVQHLGWAARYADSENHAKIKATWPEYWAKYKELGEQLRQKETVKSKSKT